MKIVCLSDFHGRCEYLGKFIDGIMKEKPDFIFFTGDIVKGSARGHEWIESKYRGLVPKKEKEEIKLEEKKDMDFYRAFYNSFGATKIKMMMVPGNMDAPWTRFFHAFKAEAKTKGNITLVHGCWTGADNYLINGFGGEITKYENENFFVLQFSEKEVKKKLSHCNGTPINWCSIQSQKLMLFHTPPFGYIEEVIKKIQPLMVCFGHSHKAGKSFIGSSLLVNPGAMKDGSWAVVELEKKEVKFYNVL